MSNKVKRNPEEESLEVHEARGDEADQGDLWNSEYGILKIPKGWVFLPSGDPFITRRVKKLGPSCVLKKSNPRQKRTETKGLYAPESNIAKAQEQAEESKEKRQKARGKGAIRRNKKEDEYKKEFRKKVLEYLDFAPEYSKNAEEIADASTDQSCQVGGGTVGRTSKLNLDQKVSLAVRAYIRHSYTNYEERLSQNMLDMSVGKSLNTYEDIKEAANLMSMIIWLNVGNGN